MELLTLSWDDIYNICLRLVEKIIRDNYRIDTIIGVSRGGLIPSRIFSDILDIHDIFVITAKYYKDINERLEKPVIRINTDIKEIRDKNMLIIDDIADTGKTMLSLIDMLDSQNIKTLTLYKKSKSIFEPDYYAEESDKWIVFPWERCETLRSVIAHNEDPSIMTLDEELMNQLIKIIRR